MADCDPVGVKCRPECCGCCSVKARAAKLALEKASVDEELKLASLVRGSYEGRVMGVFTSGGDSQGMNATLRSAVRMASYLGCETYFINEGYQGMVEGGEHIQGAQWTSVCSIIQKGGTVIGSARCTDFMEREGRLKACKNLLEKGITNLVCIGGDGTLSGANVFREEWKSLVEELETKGEIDSEKTCHCAQLNIIGVLGSIDNDFCGTEMTIGSDSALHRILDSVDSINSTADSHQRTFIMEVMGRHCGYLALVAAIASAADHVFIPESPDNTDWPDVLCEKLLKKRSAGKRLNIIILAEGAVDVEGTPITADLIKAVIVEKLSQDTRITVLGHVQRGGSPSAFDRILACRMGAQAVVALMEAKADDEPHIIALIKNKINRVPFLKCLADTKGVLQAMQDKQWDNALKLRGSVVEHNLEVYKMLTRPKPSDEEFEELKKKDGFSLGVLHIGSPAGGMNATVRSFVKSAIWHGCTIYGIQDGLNGLIDGEIQPLEWKCVSGWVGQGGANLGANRRLPGDQFPEIAARIKEYGIQGLALIGGFKAFETAIQFEEKRSEFSELNIPICVLPSTIGNDVPGTAYSIGCDTALNEVTEICDRIRQSAQGTRRRVFVVETMGRHCGFLATLAGLGAGADAVYIFEEKAGIKDMEQDILDMTIKMEVGVHRGLVLRNEESSEYYNTEFVHRLYSEEGKGIFTTRSNIIGHMQQGGSPTPFDRQLGSKMGANAVEWMVNQLNQGKCDVVLEGSLGAYDFEFTPVQDLKEKSDFKNCIPKDQWWMKLRPLLRILARHDKCYHEHH